MADVRSEVSEVETQHETRTPETVPPRTYSLLRPSAFTVPSTTTTTAVETSSHDRDETSTTSSSSGRFLLRPSALDRQAASLLKDSSVTTSSVLQSSPFHLEPAKLCSPLSSRFADNNKSVATFMSTSDAGSNTSDVKCDNVSVSSSSANSTSEKASTSEASSEPSTQTFIFGQELQSRVTALPTSTSVVTTSTDSVVPAQSAGFVFGSNLADRVVMATTTTEAPRPESVGDVTTATVTHSDKLASEHTDIAPGGEGSSQPTLAESAAAHQAKHSHVELQEVEVVTGEEDESNVFQLNVKLFVFDTKTQSWVERGLGLLRLNDRCLPSDAGAFQSRPVMRVQGSLRVVLNTMIWPAMLVERSSQRSVKISAIDADNSIKIYLIQANVADADQIYHAIYSRAHKLKTSSTTSSSSVTKQTSAVHKDVTLSTRGSLLTEKRSSDCVADSESTVGDKRRRLDIVEPTRDQIGDESNDSSVADPETEASNEGFSSSPPIPSSSSEA